MKKDEIITLLAGQLEVANKRITELLNRINDLTACVRSLEQALLDKEESLEKQKNINRGLTRIASNTSEKQRQTVPVLSGEERLKKEEEKAAARKARKNNGARRETHPELEVEEHDVYPDAPDFNISLATEIKKYQRTCVRYECIPMRFIKHVYTIHCYAQGDCIYKGKTPESAFLNSNYDASFVAGLMELRYMQAMPVERIIKYFRDHGCELNKPTAHKLIEKASGLIENLYKAVRKCVLEDSYIASDETYYRILVPIKNEKGKGVRKGYFWVLAGMRKKLIYVLYEDGSRRDEVILKELGRYAGLLQSDAYSGYKKLEGKDFPDIIRIACLQHIKRKFIDCEGDPDAVRMIFLINRLYMKEKEHKIGVDGWTVEDNFRYRQEYAPEILAEIKDFLTDILDKPDLPPKSRLATAANYMRNEWDAMVNIFNYGDTSLDNNLIERYNRYFSMSRRSSLFFGSHAGAERAAMLYTLALSCKMNGINFFKYAVDVINRMGNWSADTFHDKYRDMLPDKWIIGKSL